MNTQLSFIFIMVLSVFISSCSQIILKKAALKDWGSRLRSYLNPSVLLSYSFFFLSTFIMVTSLRYVPLSFAPVIECCGYVFVAILGAIFLKERFNKRQVFGMGLIILGVVIFSF